MGNQPWNAIWVIDRSSKTPAIYLPLLSAPDCTVVPPYGERYVVQFLPSTSGPAGTFPSCTSFTDGTMPCYVPARGEEGSTYFEGTSGLTYTLSTFDSNGIAMGQVGTLQGIVPLVVKNCM